MATRIFAYENYLDRILLRTLINLI